MVILRIIRPIVFNGGKLFRISGASSTKFRFFATDAIQPAGPNELEEFLAKHEVSVLGKDAEKFRPILNFDETSFSEPIVRTLKEKYDNPSVIQSVSWPCVLAGRDLVGIARTGSGKTLAFLLPALVHISKQESMKRGDGPIALVLCPTRELAQQVEAVSKEWSTVAGRVRSMCAFGGADRGPQEHKLNSGVELVVATPGRLNDFLNVGVTNMHKCSYLVLDEADRMLDMGFEPQIRQIITRIRKNHQTMMYSATWPSEVRRLASDFMGDYIYAKIGSAELAANKNITQMVHVTTKSAKDNQFWHLLQQLKERDPNGKILVFALQKAMTDQLSYRATNKGFAASSIHGDKSQNMRNRILRDFRSGHIRVLFATDVAARGLDVDDIGCVVNYDHPFCVEDYVHRIGRTARRDAKGESHTFMTEENAGEYARDLIKVLGASEQPVSQELHDLAAVRAKVTRASPRRWGMGGTGGDGNGEQMHYEYQNRNRRSFGQRGRNTYENAYDRFKDSDRWNNSGSDRYSNFKKSRRDQDYMDNRW